MVKSSETEGKERMETSSLMEQILSSDNLNRAYLQVVRNKGAEGVDGMKYTELKGQENINLSQYEEWRYQSLVAVSETWEYQQ